MPTAVDVDSGGSEFSAQLTPPPLDHPHGRGLWLAAHLCDLVHVRADGNGTTVTVVIGR